MNLQVCIDESGDTGSSSKSSKYFVVCAVVVDNLDTLRRLARDIHRKKYNKKKGNILHAYAESPELRNKIVKKLNLLNIRCVACVIKKDKNTIEDIYIRATKNLASYFDGQDVEVIIVAKRDTRKSYNNNILDIYKEHNIKAVFSDPSKDKSLQIADFYSWSVYSHFEKSNSIYFNKLLSQIDLL